VAREHCDRADISIRRALNCGWITIPNELCRQQLYATLRIALDMEVEAGGPYPVEQWQDWPADTSLPLPDLIETILLSDPIEEEPTP